MLHFVHNRYRVIAHDRRGHGRSSPVSDGHDIDHYAADVAAVVNHLDLRNAIHVGHSTGGGEAARYVARHDEMSQKDGIAEQLGAVTEAGVPGRTAEISLAPGDRVVGAHLSALIGALVEIRDHGGVVPGPAAELVRQP